jgi:hypothetical protein
MQGIVNHSLCQCYKTKALNGTKKEEVCHQQVTISFTKSLNSCCNEVHAKKGLWM